MCIRDSLHPANRPHPAPNPLPAGHMDQVLCPPGTHAAECLISERPPAEEPSRVRSTVCSTSA
eukprot:12889229-Alexandrium_andersonii.AAC.1